MAEDIKNAEKVLSQEEVEAIQKENEDLLRRNDELNENLNQIAAERENYKRVALSKKGKLPDDETAEDLDEKVRTIVAEQLSGTKEAQLLKEKDSIVKRLTERNKELTVALKSREQVGTRGSGGGEPSGESKGTQFWTEEQLSYFKKHGIDPNKAQENYLKLKEK